MKTNDCETVAEPCVETATAGFANAPRVALTLKGGKELKKAVALLKTCVVTRASLPFMEMILIESEGEGVARLTANSKDRSISVCVACAWSGEGVAFGIPFKAIEAGVKSGGDCLVEMRREKGALAATVNALPCLALPASEFPPDFLNREEEICAFEMPVREFAREMAFAEPAQSEDETRFVLKGVYMKATVAPETGKARFECVATDGRRLHRGVGFDAMAEWFSGERKGLGVIVPLESVKVIRASIALGNRVFVGINGKGKDEATHLTVCVRGGAFPVDFGSKLVAEKYPNYSAVIPKENPVTGKFKPSVVADVARKLKAWRKENAASKEERCSIAFKNEGGRLWARVITSGKEAQFELTGCSLKAVKEYGEGETIIAIDADYLIDAMDANEGSELVEISVKDEVSPMVVTSENGVSVVMPLRLK